MEKDGKMAEDNARVVYINDEVENESIRKRHKYSTNDISTAKYSPITFLPKILFEFFRVVANVYFFFISVLQIGTPWSPTNKYTTAGPLAIVLFVSMIKQGMEDKRRHEDDRIQNGRKCYVLSSRGELICKKWRELQVGDILRMADRDEAPADIAILSSSEEEGKCFVETCNLDGETNLKRRCAIEQVSSRIGHRPLSDPPRDEEAHARAVAQIRGVIKYEQPNNRLYTFTGRLDLQESGDNEQTSAPVGPSNIILRGCSLRACSYIYGLVVFTGVETKLMQNARSTPSKQSNVAKMANSCVLVVFSIQTILCFISTALYVGWKSSHLHGVWYLGSIMSDEDAVQDIVSFFTFLILYNNLVPISLYVSLDIVRVIQAKFIATDDEMMYEDKNAIVRTSDLNEELGQVAYIFTDKTGTLTRNQMEFRKCFIGGVSYGFGTTEIGRAVAQLRHPKREEEGDEDDADDEKKYHPVEAQINFDPTIHFDDPRLIDILDKDPMSDQALAIDMFLTILSVCHTVIPETSAKDGTIEYRASSPDEEALVKAAKCLGYEYMTPAPSVAVEVKKKSGASDVRSYMVLNVNEFNSTRKRMSVVVQSQDNQYWLFCKGADNVMLQRCKDSDQNKNLNASLNQFAREGLRTLVLAYRWIGESEYLTWNKLYQEALTALDNRDRYLAAIAEMIETDMTVAGATAIEDKLQEGVPRTISDLSRAGIRIWMLTGDKEETAINIGHACRLIDDQMTILVINQEDVGKLADQIHKIYSREDVQRHMLERSVSTRLALVCDGKSLVHIFPPKAKMTCETEGLAKKLSAQLLCIGSVCRAFIACRVSPAQKADLVQLVRYNSPRTAITLAIGDGANDVNMIQSAHVGIGISGQEGVQAVNASDYAIAQFRFLGRLLLVHGRSNYKRISKVILYSFYKNAMLVTSLFYFNFFNGQSGTSLFESFIMAGWNFFLALPIIAVGVFDQDVAPDQVVQYPKLYTIGQRNKEFNLRKFIIWMWNAAVHAIVCNVMVMSATEELTAFSEAFYLQTSLLYSALLFTANLKVMLETGLWTSVHTATMTFSILLFFIFTLIFPFVPTLGDELGEVSLLLLQSPYFWLSLLLVPSAANIYDVVVKYVSTNYFPKPVDILRERGIRGIKSNAVAIDPVSHRSETRGMSSAPASPIKSKPYFGFAFNYPDQALPMTAFSERSTISRKVDAMQMRGKSTQDLVQ